VNETVDLFGRPEPIAARHHQLPLPLGWRDDERQEEETLLVGSANRNAVAALRGWQHWGTPIAILYGPPRSGKSALAGWFRKSVPGASAIDPADTADEAACFHACNRALAGEGPLLLVVPGTAGSWRPDLADLNTRVRAAQQLEIEMPDPEFYAALLQRRVADAALHLPADVARYIAERGERSFIALDVAAERLVAMARMTGQRLSLPVVRAMLTMASPVEAGRKAISV
jgi:chromosomal replication initiation ATPase DnaA